MSSIPQNFKCDTCKSTSQDPRNLAVFIDGTSNKFGPNNTNVVKLFRQVKIENENSLKQSKNYWSGIGTQADDVLNHMGKISRLMEMAIALNVEDNVKGAYRWLVEEYEKGAQIYLFGFSRGAYQVRVLAGLIHEVGLTKSMEHVEMACDHYRRIHTDEQKAREMATEFKKGFCWPDVRIHFVGVWDTVSSVGFFKRDTFVSASASMTNACYFRHALALDERRVKFMPEYFVELNTHQNETSSSTVDDHAKEVWFAGSHTDVGGRTRSDRILFSQEENEYLYHAGHASLLWMRREAAAKGLVLNPEDIIWVPDDIGRGRADSMTPVWWPFEVLPVRHQVSFSGAGKHKRRWHWFQPRQIIPNQKVHVSVLFWDEYAASATLGHGIYIPFASPKVLQRAPEDGQGLWETEFRDEQLQRATTDLLVSLLSDPNKMLDSFERVLFLLESKQHDHTWVERIPDWPHPFQDAIHSHAGFPKLAFIIIYFIASGFSIPNDMAHDAGHYLTIVLSRPEHPDCPRVLSSIRSLTRYPRFPPNDILASSAIQALEHALEWTVDSRNQSFFPIVVDSLCNLMDNDNLPTEQMDWLCSGLQENRAPETGNMSSTSRLTSILQVKATSHSVASLRIIISLARHRPDVCRELKPQILKLATRKSSRVGPAAMEALVALDPNEPPPLRDLRFSNVLRYLGKTLPYLDIEYDNVDVETSRSSASDALSGDRPALGTEIFDKLVSTAGSWNARERAAAILTLLKLCGDWKTCREVRSKAVDVFVGQLRRQKTSLLAAYAVKTCLDCGMNEYFEATQVGPLIVSMLKNGWFDDSVGRLEGFDVFRGLMRHDDLKDKVIELDITEYLVRQLEVRKHPEDRPILIIFDTLGLQQERLTEIVNRGLDHLRSPRRITQSKGVKILSALARTAAGKAIVRPQMPGIVDMLLPPDYMQTAAHSIRPIPSVPTFGPIATLHAFCRNDELRREIKRSSGYASLRHLHQTSVLYKK